MHAGEWPSQLSPPGKALQKRSRRPRAVMGLRRSGSGLPSLLEVASLKNRRRRLLASLPLPLLPLLPLLLLLPGCAATGSAAVLGIMLGSSTEGPPAW